MTKLILLILLFSISSFASDKKIYAKFSLGGVITESNKSKDETKDAFKEDFNVDEENQSVTLGASVYRKINDKLLLGLAYMTTTDKISGDSKDKNEDLEISIGYSHLLLTGLYYLTNDILSGFYIEAGVGMGSLVTEYNDKDSLFGTIFDPDSTNGEDYEKDERGAVINLSFGKSFQIQETRSIDLELANSFLILDTETVFLSFLAVSLKI